MRLKSTAHVNKGSRVVTFTQTPHIVHREVCPNLRGWIATNQPHDKVRLFVTPGVNKSTQFEAGVQLAQVRWLLCCMVGHTAHVTCSSNFLNDNKGKKFLVPINACGSL